MTTTPCTACAGAPSGEAGHPQLEHQIEGPYPGHHIFLCRGCGERWIRHYGFVHDKHAWTRYDQQFIVRKPLADNERPTGARGRTSARLGA